MFFKCHFPRKFKLDNPVDLQKVLLGGHEYLCAKKAETKTFVLNKVDLDLNHFNQAKTYRLEIIFPVKSDDLIKP